MTPEEQLESHKKVMASLDESQRHFIAHICGALNAYQTLAGTGLVVLACGEFISSNSELNKEDKGNG